MRQAGAQVSYEEIDTLSGHDAFLKDWAELRTAIDPFLNTSKP